MQKKVNRPLMGLMVAMLAFFATNLVPVDAQENQEEQAQQQENTVEEGDLPLHRKSWSLFVEASTPDLHVYRSDGQARESILYTTVTVQNNFSYPVPYALNFRLKTDYGVHTPITDPFIEKQIIAEEANLQGFSEGIRNEKVLQLKQNGRFLNWLEARRGRVSGKGLVTGNNENYEIDLFTHRQHEFLPAQFGNFLPPGPEGLNGSYMPELSDHPSEIKVLVMFRNVDLRTRNLTLKVGNHSDPRTRVGGPEYPDQEYLLKPEVLHISWSWNAPRMRKKQTLPRFSGRRNVQEQFGPLASTDTIHNMIQMLGIENEEERPGRPFLQNAVHYLRSFTGQNFDYNPDEGPSSEGNQQALNRWKEWWSRNKHDLLYVGRPQPLFMTLKHTVTEEQGGESPEEVFQNFLSSWNNQNWQMALNTFIFNERNKEHFDQVLSMMDRGEQVGSLVSSEEQEEDLFRLTFQVNDREISLNAERTHGKWFLSLP